MDSDDIPRGTRPRGKDDLFRSPSQDPRIVPDRVGPVVEGYFRAPAVWVGDVPADADIAQLNPAIHHSVAYRATLACGIKVRVNRDGLFLFDFTDWKPAPPVVIPGYIKPENETHKYPVEHHDAEVKAEESAIIRAQVMNAHQACLTTAERMLKRRSASMGFPVTAWSTHKALTLDTPSPYHDDMENLHALVQNMANNKYGLPREKPRSRPGLEVDVIRRSFEILDKMLTGGELHGVRLIESAFIASHRRREKRFGEAITLGWTVCEQLVSILWRRMLDDARQENAGRMSKERRQKLTGRDYSASVMSEMLEINGRIDHELFRMLEVGRKARNAWAHEMRAPSERSIHFCFKAIENLMATVLGVPLVLGGGGRGGVPQWPVWMWRGFNPAK